MSKVKGLDLLISIGTGEEKTVLGGQRNATLNRSAELIDVTDKLGDGWKENLSSFKEWSIDCDGLYVASDAAFLELEEAYEAGDAVDIELAQGVTIVYKGKAFITDFPLEAPYDDALTYSISLAGTAALN